LSDGWTDVSENDVVNCDAPSTALAAPPSIIYLKGLLHFTFFHHAKRQTERMTRAPPFG